MKNKNIAFVILIFLLDITHLIAQDEQTGLEKIIAESWQGNFRPFIEADYGIGKSSHLDLRENLTGLGQEA